MSVDSIGNFLTVVRNAAKVSRPSVTTSYSRMNNSIAEILKKEGFIRDVQVLDQNGKKNLEITLKYVDGESVIHELNRISKLSRRTYTGVEEIKPVIDGLGITILSTNRGVISHKDAKKLGVGGEIICTVW